MPAKSIKQRRLIIIAEHFPEKVSKKNSSVLSMTKSQMKDYASTREKGLPVFSKKGKSK